jgi:hypothetical protein
MLLKLGVGAIIVSLIAQFFGIGADQRAMIFISGFLLLISEVIWKLLAPAKPSNQPRSAPLSKSEALRHKAIANLVSLNAHGDMSDADYLRARSRLEAPTILSGLLALFAAAAAARPTADSNETASIGDTTEDDGSVFGVRLDEDHPQFNIDGTPMMGAFDMNGNIYGVTDHHGSGFDDDFMASDRVDDGFLFEDDSMTGSTVDDGL